MAASLQILARLVTRTTLPHHATMLYSTSTTRVVLEHARDGDEGLDRVPPAPPTTISCQKTHLLGVGSSVDDQQTFGDGCFNQPSA